MWTQEAYRPLRSKNTLCCSRWEVYSTPPQPELGPDMGWGIPSGRMDVPLSGIMGYPPSGRMGVTLPCPPSRCELTNWKQVPSPILWMRALINLSLTYFSHHADTHSWHYFQLLKPIVMEIVTNQIHCWLRGKFGCGQQDSWYFKSDSEWAKHCESEPSFIELHKCDISGIFVQNWDREVFNKFGKTFNSTPL